VKRIVAQFKEAQKKRGKVTEKKRLPVEISNITDKGFQVRVPYLNRDYYLSFERYPYFSDATEEELRDAVCEWEAQINWKSLDLNFEFELLDHPEKSGVFCPYVRGELRKDLFVGFHLPMKQKKQTKPKKK
jgi:hypothetical protein